MLQAPALRDGENFNIREKAESPEVVEEESREFDSSSEYAFLELAKSYSHERRAKPIPFAFFPFGDVEHDDVPFCRRFDGVPSVRQSSRTLRVERVSFFKPPFCKTPRSLRRFLDESLGIELYEKIVETASLRRFCRIRRKGRTFHRVVSGAPVGFVVGGEEHVEEFAGVLRRICKRIKNDPCFVSFHGDWFVVK